MILPLRYFAERFLNCEFHHAISFDIHQMFLTKPDIVVTPNTTGSTLYCRIAQEASRQNIPLFSLISEGNFKTDGSYNHWGYNKERRFFQEYVCCWSKRTQEYLAERQPEAKEKIVFTGYPGCDRYAIYKPTTRENFLKAFGLPHYKRIIGYAGWTFNKLRFPRGVQELQEFFGIGDAVLPCVEHQRALIRDILHDSIRSNSDTLFILRRHPQDISPELVQQAVNEMEGLDKFENVLSLGDEEALHDVISVCDLWTCFESTTAIEAWLLQKPTVFLNPDPEFKRSDLVKGSAVARSSVDLQRMIDELYGSGAITEFSSSDKARLRRDLIADSVGFGDGLNHIRASYYFKNVIDRLPSFERRRRFSLVQFLVHLFTIIGGMFYVRSLYRHIYKLKKHLWVFENFRMQKIETLYTRYSTDLRDFYSKHNIEERFKGGSLFSTIFPRQPEPPQVAQAGCFLNTFDATLKHKRTP
ncbi:MAG TPA: hypothetical protein VMH23_14550 [Bacteroidota bacterium]|nr:hypothetical protein [Bacteroidota bacterium]